MHLTNNNSLLPLGARRGRETLERSPCDVSSDEEIKAAIQIAAEIQRFSTLLYGNEFDVDIFNKIIGRDKKE